MVRVRRFLITPEPAWLHRIALVDEALARGEFSRAIYEWRETYGAAIGSGGWEALAEVDDRAVRISRVTGGSRLYLTEARESYLHALSRARTARSLEGVERIAETFERLGDVENARHAVALRRACPEAKPGQGLLPDALRSRDLKRRQGGA